MTDIDLKRLAVDREYWPKEAEAFFYMPERVFKTFFAKSAKHSDFSIEDMSGGWIGEKLDGESYHVFSECWEMIPRPPKKVQEVEWQDGLPPVGERVEYDTGFQNWCPATVIAKGHDHSEEVVVIQTTNRMFIVDAGDRIRPLKTDAERQREELVELVLSGMKDCEYYPYETDVNSIADAILSKYNLEPKP